MEIEIRVITADSEYVVKTCLMDWVNLERAYKTTTTQVLSDLSMENLSFLAHSAAKAGGHNPPARLDDFILTIKDIVPVEKDDAASVGPTDGGQ